MGVSYNNVSAAVDSSTRIGIGWSKKEDFIGHTAIAILWDGTPRFTIDFGAPNDAPSTSSFLPNMRSVSRGIDSLQGTHFASKVEIKGWKPICQLKGVFVDVFDRDLAKALIREMLDIEMEPYDVNFNNCRDYCARAVRLLQVRVHGLDASRLRVFPGEFDFFWERVDRIIQRDRTKMAVGASALAVATFPLVALGGVASWALLEKPEDRPGSDQSASGNSARKSSTKLARDRSVADRSVTKLPTTDKPVTGIATRDGPKTDKDTSDTPGTGTTRTDILDHMR